MRSTHPLGQVSLAYLGDGTPGVIDMTVIMRWKVFLRALSNQSRQLWVVDECHCAQQLESTSLSLGFDLRRIRFSIIYLSSILCRAISTKIIEIRRSNRTKTTLNYVIIMNGIEYFIRYLRIYVCNFYLKILMIEETKKKRVILYGNL